MAQSPVPATPFTADSGDELPVSVQLSWRLRALIASSRLAAGDRMPSVRSLAEWAGVNVNTVRGVYARLEDEGLIVTRHGAGSYVAEGAGGSPEVERIAAEAIDAALAAGVEPAEVARVALVSSSLPAGLDPPLPVEIGPGDSGERPLELTLEELAAELEIDDSWLEADELGARRELRRQIGRLEAQLAGYRRDLESLAQPAPLTPPEPRIASAAELEQTRDALLRQLAAARNAAAERARRERRAREVRDALIADPAAHRWEVVSAAETGEEGCTTWEAAPHLGPLGALMSWWRVKVSGGCPLCPSQP
jgi:DNA-binding transcriptional regulator YhcF (GntR family)